MARARNIKPAFFTDEDIAELPVEGRLMLIGMWTLADQSGVLKDRPKRIRMQVLPFDDVDADQLLELMEGVGVIQRFNGEIHIRNWGYWQPDALREPRGGESVKWRKAVLGRDGNQCVKCGARHRLEAHHILHWATHPEERFNVNNGVTLCTECHKEEHRRKDGD